MVEEEKQPEEETEAPAAEEPAAEESQAEESVRDTEREHGDADLDPRARRKLERSRASTPALPPRTPEERAAERAQARAANAESRRRYRSRRGRGEDEPGQGTPPAERRPGPKKVRVGTVVSTKAEKTITVRIEDARRHPAYEKIVRRSSTLHAHDERNEANEGDVVRVIETRPLSKTKRWRLLEVVERAR